MKTIFDRDFRYTRSVDTDLRKTFARARRQLREETERIERAEAETRSKVSPIKPNKNAFV